MFFSLFHEPVLVASCCWLTVSVSAGAVRARGQRDLGGHLAVSRPGGDGQQGRDRQRARGEGGPGDNTALSLVTWPQY